MTSKSTIRVVLFAGMLALVPAMAHAFTGMLITCNPTDGVPGDAFFKPGLDCTDVVNKISAGATLDGCSANLAAPWNTWAGVKYPTKITSTLAGTITQFAVKIKAKTFGSCNFSGDPSSFSANGAAKFTLLDAAGNKIGKGSATGVVSGDLPSQSAAVKGIIIKGDLAGARATVLIGIDIAAPENANVLACNLGAVCPPPVPPSTDLKLKTTSTSRVYIGIAQNSDCTSATTPWECCTGAGAGNC